MNNTIRSDLFELSNPTPHIDRWLSLTRPTVPEPPSPLMLSDRLLTLAKDAEKAGCVGVASRLLALAHVVLDPPNAGSFAVRG